MLVTGGYTSNMDSDLFLQNLRDLPLEEGKAYIQEHIGELADHAVIGNLLADEALRLLYSPFVSLKLAELLIFYGDNAQHTMSHALGLKAKGDALEQIGHHQAAMDSLDGAGEEFLSLGDEGNWARSRISWMLACAWLGRVEEALNEASRTRDVFLRINEPFWACAIDHNTAVIYEQIGRYQDAVKIYEGMRAIYPTLTDQNENSIKQRIALAEMNEAINLVWIGNIAEAYHLHEQALNSYIALNEVDLIVDEEVNLADLDCVQGYYGSALRRYYQARNILEQNKLENPLLLAEIKFCIANCLVKLNRTQEACLLASEAVELHQQFGVSLSTGNALRDYAITLEASGRVNEAISALNQAWILLKQREFNLYAYAAKLQQAELLLENGDVVESYNQAKLVKSYFEALGIARYAIRANLVMAESRIAIAKQTKPHGINEQQVAFLEEAILLCKHTALLSRQNNFQEEAYKSHYLLGRIYVLQKNPRKSARQFRAAIAQIERILDDLVYDLSPSFLQSAWVVYEDMIALCLEQDQVERAFSYLEQARSMSLLQYLNKSNVVLGKGEEYNDSNLSSGSLHFSGKVLHMQQELKDWQERYREYSLLLENIDTSVSPSVDREIFHSELMRCEAKINELFERIHLYRADTPHESRTAKRAQPRKNRINLEQIRQCLSPGQLLLSYFLYKKGLVIFAITTDNLIMCENPDGIAQLERLLPLLFAHLNPISWPDPHHPSQQVVLRLLKKLYGLLITPVSTLLPASSGNLTIVPFGPLHKLPFHALHNGSHFLIEDFQMNYLPTSNLLTHQGANGSEKIVRSTIEDVSAKPPLVFGYSENGYLQRVQDEVSTITSMLDGNGYFEAEATIARLINEAPGSPIIHLATHGGRRLDAPNFSFVRLADGYLNAIDAFSLDLKVCELVTLSGCETGLALSGGGDEQLGLGRAFLAAGASSLIMSLWSVEDNATTELMKLFYLNLLKGESKVQALRAAQCQLLQNTSSGYTHPYYWAAFQLVGDVGPLKSLGAKDLSVALTTGHLKSDF